MSRFWSSAVDDAIRCYNSLPASLAKDILFERKIYPALSIIINSNLFAVNQYCNDDLRQDSLIKIIEIMPNICDYKSSQAYITTVVRNYILQAIKRPALLLARDFSNLDVVDSYSNDEQAEQRLIQRKKVIDDINCKIASSSPFQNTKISILNAFKKYLIDNNFDPKGFVLHCSDTLHLAQPSILRHLSELGIKCRDLR